MKLSRPHLSVESVIIIDETMQVRPWPDLTLAGIKIIVLQSLH